MSLGLPKWRRDDVITAADLNRLVAAIERIRINRGQSTGLDIAESPGGTTIRARRPTDRYLALVESPGITARMGTSPGQGTVTLCTYDPANNINSTGATGVFVLNFSSATAGIPAGNYCWCQEDVNGHLWIVSAECS